MTTNPPPAAQWVPNYPPQPVASPRTWPLVALAIIAIVGVVLGAAALVVALTRPGNAGSAAAPTTTASPTYTAEEIAAAHQKLCEVYKLAARSVQIDTNGGDPALAGVTGVNGAVMLEQALRTAPALAPDERDAAFALAEAYTNANAVASFSTGRGDPAWRAAADDVIAKDAEMRATCGGG
nr:hypothetical protein [Mycobacterium ulcerans]